MNKGENQVNKGEIQVPGDSAEYGGDSDGKANGTGNQTQLRYGKANSEKANSESARKLNVHVHFIFRFEKGLEILRPAGGDPGLDHLQIIFLTVCVSLTGLGPSETHEKLSMSQMCDSSKEKRRKVGPSLTPFGAAAATALS